MLDNYFVFSTDTLKNKFFINDTQIKVKQIIHAEHRTNPQTILDHVMSLLDLSGSEYVLDLGCGNGFFLREVAKRLTLGGQAVGLDLAPGVLEAARTALLAERLEATLVEGSADDLNAFKDSSFDRVMANYMMHYVPDIPKALQEICRVLRPNGLFVLSTDSSETMPEMYNLHHALIRKLGFPERLYKRSPKGRFCIENGFAPLQTTFKHVSFVPYEDRLLFETHDPFMRFYVLGHSFCGASAVPAIDLTPEMFDRLYAETLHAVQDEIARSGAFVVTKRSGCFVCY